MGRPEFYTIIAGVLAILGFVTTIWVAASFDIRERLDDLEVDNAVLKCMVDPEICKEILGSK